MLTAPITYGQGIILGLLQGVAELFPISSLGQSVVAPRAFGWNIHQNDNYFIAFLVATHLATAIVLLGFFWRDWVRILTGMWRSLKEREISASNPDGKLGWLIVVGTIPAGILGLLLQDTLQSVFASARSAAFFLILNGIMLFGAEMLRRRAPELPEVEEDGDHRIAHTAGWRHAVGVGASQAIALIRRDDGRRPPGRLLERGRGPVRVPAGDADHRRRRAAQDPCAARPRRRRRARAGAGRVALLGRDGLRVDPLPDALLRDEPADAVRRLLLHRGDRALDLVRRQLS
jgi:undecaprenyl-diphosphatase